MNFCSDNTTGVAPEILAAIARAASVTAMPYGQDELSLRLDERFGEIFQTPVRVFPVATGTAANGLALAALSPPYGAIYCHAEAHINVDECAAPEFYTGGAKIVALAGANGKLHAGDLDGRLRHAGKRQLHYAQPAAISVSQSSEAGTVYSTVELHEIAAVARRHGLRLHMDGARFANALASLEIVPAELTWRAGIDVLSLGATKNGALAAEAVIFFDPAMAEEFGYRVKRGGHIWSKMRFLAAQLLAYVEDDLWLRHARHANRMAAKLAAGLEAIDGTEIIFPVQANEVFVHLKPGMADALMAEGFRFYRWERLGLDAVRLVTSYATDEADAAAFIAVAERASGSGQRKLR